LAGTFSLGDSSNWRALEAVDSSRLTGFQTRAVVPTVLLDSLNRTDTLFREMKLLTDSTAFPLYRFPIDAHHWGLLTLVPWVLGGLDGQLFLSVVNIGTGSVSCTRVLSQSALTQANAIGVWALRRVPEGTFHTQEKIYWFHGYTCPPPACPPRYRLAYDYRAAWAFAPDASGNLCIHRLP
jgi:hypothetical protein